MRHLIRLIGIAIIVNCYAIARAQEYGVIKGEVLALLDNRPIAGATLELSPSGQQATTNRDGRFTVQLTGPVRKITARFVGYKTFELQIDGNKDTVLIHLEPDLYRLNEVTVNTGYQRIPKERATGSFELVDNAVINQIIGPNILSRLEGNSSLYFDKDPRRPAITLRGIGTIEGNTGPLIIVDDFPYEGDINSIDPDIVENISILKDAAAASVWGARASNGVIVITTKKGAFNSRAKISFNTSLQHLSRPDLSYYQQISSRDLIEVEEFLFNNGYYTTSETNSQQYFLSPVVELLIAHRDQVINDGELQGELDRYRSIDNRKQYSKYMYRNGLNQRYALNIMGGTKKHSYFLLGGLDNNVDNLSSRFKRYNFQANNDFKVTSKLELNTKLSFVHTESGSGFDGYSPGVYARPYLNLLDGEGLEMPHYRIRKSFAETAAEGLLLDWAEYPLSDALHDTRVSKRQSLMASLGVNYGIADGLKISLLYRYEQENGEGEIIRDMESYYTRDLINHYTTIDPNSNLASYAIPRGAIYDSDLTKQHAHNARAQLNYNKEWSKQQLNVVFGGEIRSLIGSGSYYRDYGFDQDRLIINSVDYLNPVKDFITGRDRYIPFVNDYNGKEINFVSQFLNASYTYGGKYIVSLSGRRDGSNQFGLATNDKWNPLWSSGVAWNISNEKFYASNLIPSLKIRATYGVTGNLDPGKTAVPIIYYQSADRYSGKIKAVITQPANPQLRWEKNRMLNLALDFNGKGGIFGGSIEYYTKRGIDLFGPAPNDITTGIGSVVTKNVANMKGRGIDLRLNVKWFKGNFKWGTKVLFSYSKSEVTNYYIRAAKLKSSSYISDGTRINPLEGYPLYSILSYPWEGLNGQGKSVSRLLGQPSEDYRAVMAADITNLVNSGSAIPTKFGSLFNSFTYKGFSLDVILNYKLGYYFRRQGLYYSTLFSMRNTGNGSQDYAKHWQKKGDEERTNVPGMVYPADAYSDTMYSNSEILVERGDHIRIQNINLGYTVNNFKGAAVHLYVNAANLGILWRANKSKIDPDYQIGLPASKAYSIGLKITY